MKTKISGKAFSVRVIQQRCSICITKYTFELQKLQQVKEVIYNMLFLLPFLILFSVIKNSIATITIADTGVHYPSEPDRWYSAHFAPGYEYMAHLQAFSYDIDLCDPNANLTVTVPTDRVPVVLLASRDSCDDWTKIKIAKTKIQPPDVVEFLIIYDIDDEEVSVERKLRTPKGDIPQNPYSNFYDDVNIGVLHVSSSTGNGTMLRCFLNT